MLKTHLAMSAGETTIELETPYTPAEVAAPADIVIARPDQAATISSGSFFCNRRHDYWVPAV